MKETQKFTYAYNHGRGRQPKIGERMTIKGKKWIVSAIDNIEDRLGRVTIKGRLEAAE